MKAKSIPDPTIRDIFMAAEAHGTMRFMMVAKTALDTYYFFKVRIVGDRWLDRMLAHDDLLAFCGFRRSGGVIIFHGRDQTYVRRDPDGWLLGTVRHVKGALETDPGKFSIDVLHPRRVRGTDLYDTREDAIAAIAGFQDRERAA